MNHFVKGCRIPRHVKCDGCGKMGHIKKACDQNMNSASESQRVEKSMNAVQTKEKEEDESEDES